MSEIFFDEIAGVTTIALANEDLATDLLNGALLFRERPALHELRSSG